MILDRWVAGCLIPLAIWLLISGLDDLFLILAWSYRWLRAELLGHAEFHWPTEAELNAAPRKHIAVLVPLWREHRVIQTMLDHNITANQYDHFDVFAGAYPNDPLTITAIRECCRRYDNVHLAVCPHEGPTSKADCLNWIYQRMLLFEEEYAVHFDIVVTHDAEDLIHPQALRFINYYGQNYDMVQVPVLALPTPVFQLTHGVYCDDFAEYQLKDVPMRRVLGGFLPSNGVGTGFSRAALEKLAAAHSNRVFEPECLTEDYENGFRLHQLKCSQMFMPLRELEGGFMATREYFPRRFKAAVRQRTRWIMGISLQSWERHGWSDTVAQLYWFWRDRKGLVGNNVSPLANLLFAYGVVSWIWSWKTASVWELGQILDYPAMRYLFAFTLALPLVHIFVRMGCVSHIYGWSFAMGVPVRILWANWLNCFANVSALFRYLSAKLRGRPLVWLKTEHAYPNRAALLENRRLLGEILVSSQYLTAAELEAALASKPPNRRLGEHLIRTSKLTEHQLYEALSLQLNIPLEELDGDRVNKSIVRSLPASVARRWKVVPFKVVAGHLYVAGPETPSEEMSNELKQFSSFEIRFHFVTPTEYEKLAARYL